MLNDYRESCVSDRDTGVKMTAECAKLLAGPAEPPPTIAKRSLEWKEWVFGDAAVWWTTLVAIPVVTWVVYEILMKRYLPWLPKPLDSMARAAIGLPKDPNAIIAKDTDQSRCDDDGVRSLSATAESDSESCKDSKLGNISWEQRLPQWERCLNADFAADSPWTRKVIFSLRS